MQLYDARLMLGSWSSMIDPIQLADKGARLTCELPAKGMSRLVEMCADETGSVHIDLTFERGSSEGLRVMHGRIVARIYLTCQRCMERLAYELRAEPRLLLLRPGEREDLLQSGEATVVERPVTLGALVEDELLLEMPMVPMHPADRCPSGRLTDAEKSASTRTHPFSVLEKLKHKDR